MCILYAIAVNSMGGYSDMKAIDDPQLKEQFDGYKSLAETFSGKTYKKFSSVKYSHQVVAGMNYWILYDIGDNKGVEMKIFVPLPFTNNPPEIKELKDSSLNV